MNDATNTVNWQGFTLPEKYFKNTATAKGKTLSGGALYEISLTPKQLDTYYKQQIVQHLQQALPESEIATLNEDKLAQTLLITPLQNTQSTGEYIEASRNAIRQSLEQFHISPATEPEILLDRNGSALRVELTYNLLEHIKPPYLAALSQAGLNTQEAHIFTDTTDQTIRIVFGPEALAEEIRNGFNPRQFAPEAVNAAQNQLTPPPEPTKIPASKPAPPALDPLVAAFEMNFYRPQNDERLSFWQIYNQRNPNATARDLFAASRTPEKVAAAPNDQQLYIRLELQKAQSALQAYNAQSAEGEPKATMQALQNYLNHQFPIFSRAYLSPNRRITFETGETMAVGVILSKVGQEKIHPYTLWFQAEAKDIIAYFESTDAQQRRELLNTITVDGLRHFAPEPEPMHHASYTPPESEANQTLPPAPITPQTLPATTRGMAL